MSSAGRSAAKTPDIQALRQGVVSGDRAALARAITLVESTRADHRDAATALLESIAARTGKALRVGVSGPPGAGKSTLLEALGNRLCDAGRRVAILAVDPTSAVRGGSILGDKTRMATLAVRDAAFIRPSPSGGELGGVHERTREAMLLCEAAGYDVVIVETVGVGQSEAAVAGLVDTLVLLLIPGAGDELQGIKKGVLELADIIAVNKSDGDNVQRAQRARRDFRAALHLVRPRSEHWTVPVMLLSGIDGTGIDELWDHVRAHRHKLEESGELRARRGEQRAAAMWRAVQAELRHRLKEQPSARELGQRLLADVQAGKTTPAAAARRIVAALMPEI